MVLVDGAKCFTVPDASMDGIKDVITQFNGFFWGVSTGFRNCASLRDKIPYGAEYIALKNAPVGNVPFGEEYLARGGSPTDVDDCERERERKWLLEKEELRAVRAMAFPFAITFLTHERCTGHIAPAPAPASRPSVIGVATTYGEAFDLVGRDGEYPDSVVVHYEFEEGNRVVVSWRR